ncbi:hypothetical protein GLOTRDRAFT_133053 [Gloeophyllum trabeum ATCC 11539]|uniref:Uncharacterized protein n=1 Tax=Gloeophyllum trabeum (strain ATCC 11539 / FP-39264 / Madison 617) TaxID=670483 RepID=S7RBQ9_GLOTA|nr:uncharacterized protein GLOTRDRAFT_133053 [Gloeophyllum trabeum ATCC 11539]EPQ51685.1 hypothetical protein GLOTRDRAFT_133053 [Gloeophyllum trabeum ATCC 11539]
MDPAIVIAVPYDRHIWPQTRSEETRSDNIWAFCSSQFLASTQKLLERHARRDASTLASPMPMLHHPKPIRAYRFVPNWVDDWDERSVLSDSGSPSTTPHSESLATPSDAFSDMEYYGRGIGDSAEGQGDLYSCGRPASTISELAHYLPREVLEELGLAPSASNSSISPGCPDTPGTSSACADPRHVQLLAMVLQEASHMPAHNSPVGGTCGASDNHRVKLLDILVKEIEEPRQCVEVEAHAGPQAARVYAYSASWADACHPPSLSSVSSSNRKPMLSGRCAGTLPLENDQAHREVLLSILN